MPEATANRRRGRTVSQIGALIALIAISGDGAHAAALDGTTMPWPWVLPFAGLLMTIAMAPVLVPRLWRRHYGPAAFMWATLAIVPIAALYDIPTAATALAHAALGEYLSLIVLLFALYVVAGGILVTGELRGTPAVNTAILALGTLIASVVGTTGAAMILIRPLLRANANRLHNAHVVVFFIILVANVGGALSPLGDPPLFAGFLRGVTFFWPVQHLWLQTAALGAILLLLFVAIDVWFYRQDRKVTLIGEPPLPPDRFRILGSINLLLLAGVIATILIASQWSSGIVYDIYGVRLALADIVRDSVLIVIAMLSLVLTPNEHRDTNGYSWEPIREVAILFAALFACLVPVMAMLQAGRDGAFAFLPVLIDQRMVPDSAAYFWLSGLTSAALNNVPGYRVFFDLAGGEASALMSPLAAILAAISMGAVFMGALTYTGNAPNLMIYTIAVERGIRMPSFFGYLFWSSLILVPPLLFITFFLLAP